jgi:hypothetical protein
VSQPRVTPRSRLIERNDAPAANFAQPCGHTDARRRAAIDDVAVNAIAFTLTVVTLLDTKVVADRIFLFVLLPDRDGEESVRLLLADRPASRPNPPAGRPGARF